MPLNDRFVDTALGVIVHSKYVEGLVRGRKPAQQLAVVPAPIALDRAPSLRERLGLPADACLFGSFGVVSHTKQLEAALARVPLSAGGSIRAAITCWWARDMPATSICRR